MLGRRQLLGGDPVEVASAIVHAIPGRASALKDSLDALPGVEIHAQTPDGRFVVTVETAAGASVGDTLLALHRADGVLAVALVSHYEDR
jgi:periplasmic nitrate reductase NapD